MIPIRDDAPKYTTPYVTYLLIALNVVIFVFELLLLPENRNAFILQFGIVPTTVQSALHVGANVSITAAFVPVLSSMFLHASWPHVIFNMWALWIFGDNVEDYLGHFRYLGFYLLTGVIAGLVHIMFNLNSSVPSVGASGAIAGIMGAYFILFPAARVLTYFFVFFTWVPAWVILGYWFVVQFISGATAAISYSNETTGGIAFWAHVGGFIAGLGLIKLIPHKAQRYSYD